MSSTIGHHGVAVALLTGTVAHFTRTRGSRSPEQWLILGHNIHIVSSCNCIHTVNKLLYSTGVFFVNRVFSTYFPKENLYKS